MKWLSIMTERGRKCQNQQGLEKTVYTTEPPAPFKNRQEAQIPHYPRNYGSECSKNKTAFKTVKGGLKAQ